MTFEDFEKYVMYKIVSENPEYEKLLTAQYESAEIIKREFTGHGFYTYFSITNSDASIGERISLTLGNINLQLNDLKNGTGYVLFIQNGLITCLEGYTYGEAWPETILNVRIC